MTRLSQETLTYFEQLEKKVDECYYIANQARKLGKDPELTVEIPKAEDMASRVEKITGIKVAEKIRKLLKKGLDREIIAILIAKEVSKQYTDKREAIEKAVRVGLSILTEGILVAPLEGITDIKIRKNRDGNSEYVAVYYSGPIRSAGGTAQAMSVLIADIVRIELNIGRYKPTLREIERYKEELQLYAYEAHLQYVPTADEVETVIRNCPVCIDGEGTIDREVSGYRDIPGIDTNRVRGGMCLVLAEGVIQKARKIKGIVDRLNIDGWQFLDKLIKAETTVSIEPSEKFIHDIVGGRPVFSHPSAKGGFRLRYGRCRTGGLATIGINPATMIILDEFIAIGTQLKLERPGKAGGVASCDSIEGPIVLLDNGDLVQVHTVKEARSIKKRVVKIIDVGEILIGYGEFLENNHPLIPASFTEDWWRAELKAVGVTPPTTLSFDQVWNLSKTKNVPLHPKYTLFWHDVSVSQLKLLKTYLVKNAHFENNRLYIKKDKTIKNILITLGALHIEKQDYYEMDELGKALIYSLGLRLEQSRIVNNAEVDAHDSITYINKVAHIRIYPKALSRIGARMGRPEKAAPRKMSPSVHVLFPLGEKVYGQRSINKIIAKNGTSSKIEVKIGLRQCPSCHKTFKEPICPVCKVPTQFMKIEKFHLKLDKLLNLAKQNLHIDTVPAVKGVKGLISEEALAEPLEKGIFRAKNSVYVYKDGTARFDMSNLAITHFKPKEIGLNLRKAYMLGYVRDYLGNDLVSEDQVCTIKVQDLIISEKAVKYLINVGNYIDELLESYYHLPRFYNFKNNEDIIGTIVMGLSPHTSGAVAARIIGFTNANVCFAHPFFHAAKRRNCDGDEDSIMLLLDGLLNFSRHYLPSTRGAMMDSPLLLSIKIDPTEIDKEALNVEIMDSYPLEFYRATLEHKNPKEVLKYMRIIRNLIDQDPYQNYLYSNDTEDINNGILESAYKTLGSMQHKTDAQLYLASKIRAVMESDVAERLINSHFMPDIMGNLRRFGTQGFRCSRCNTAYRRMPLNKRCKKCGGNVILTIYKGSIEKYLKSTKLIAENFNVSQYTKQRVLLLESSINSIFSENFEPVKEKNNIRTLEEFL